MIRVRLAFTPMRWSLVWSRRSIKIVSCVKGNDKWETGDHDVDDDHHAHVETKRMYLSACSMSSSVGQPIVLTSRQKSLSLPLSAFSTIVIDHSKRGYVSSPLQCSSIARTRFSSASARKDETLFCSSSSLNQHWTNSNNVSSTTND